MKVTRTKNPFELKVKQNGKLTVYGATPTQAVSHPVFVNFYGPLAASEYLAVIYETIEDANQEAQLENLHKNYGDVGVVAMKAVRFVKTSEAKITQVPTKVAYGVSESSSLFVTARNKGGH